MTLSNADDEFLNLHEFVKAARLKLNQYIWDYLVGGTETETTLRRNRQALDSVAFRPRVLVDVSTVDTSHEFFGRKIRLPVALAPVGSLESFEAGAGASVSKAAGDYGVPVFVSSVTQPSLEQIAAAGSGPKVFQLYVRGDDQFIDDHVKRAVDSGYDAFCLTVDTAHYSRRERDIAKRFRKPWRANNTGMEFQAGLNWGHVERFKAKHKIPLIIKGIATGADAERAVSLGVDVVYVSNHGGRQMDHGRGSVDVLPEVVAAVAGRAKVYVDGGFSRGSDILKGIALGADLVVVGRLYCYGLAANGSAGVQRVLEILEDEVHECLGLCGATSFKQLDRTFVHPAMPVVTPHVHSAFPLLTLNEGY
ncbi:MAG: alpha-hydroxy-acid oxidizing enzyme [Acetobacteraceae bacterium SCN 69-10]|nr:alpha-hydroxy-acid oxidizing protein [Rhodospirillales bacterium]ODU62530.1 MAG: alpha-hydroxy-acid oxidizing enzyme [Acetobacteraceae bacterium SCN 69-10]OJY76846.1 MAG: alpha-hydroxy-acid oxidizing enzyme [Rhodospirillales bacterium 70-18]